MVAAGNWWKNIDIMCKDKGGIKIKKFYFKKWKRRKTNVICLFFFKINYLNFYLTIFEHVGFLRGRNSEDKIEISLSIIFDFSRSLWYRVTLIDLKSMWNSIHRRKYAFSLVNSTTIRKDCFNLEFTLLYLF